MIFPSSLQVDGLLHDTNLLRTTIRAEFHRFHLLSNQQFIESVRNAPAPSPGPLPLTATRSSPTMSCALGSGSRTLTASVSARRPQRVYDEDDEAARPPPKPAASALTQEVHPTAAHRSNKSSAHPPTHPACKRL